MSECKMSETNLKVEKWTNIPEGLVSIIASYNIGCERWRRLKQCDALGSYKGNGNSLFTLTEWEKVDIVL